VDDLFANSDCDETPELAAACDETSRCVVCGDPVERASTGPPRDYCSRSYQARAYRARKEAS